MCVCQSAQVCVYPEVCKSVCSGMCVSRGV